MYIFIFVMIIAGIYLIKMPAWVESHLAAPKTISAEESQELYTQENLVHVYLGLFRLKNRTPDLKIYYTDNIMGFFKYRQDDSPHYRTIAFTNAATTEYVDNSGYYMVRNPFPIGYKMRFYDHDIFFIELSEELYQSAMEANVPRLTSCYEPHDEPKSLYSGYGKKGIYLADELHAKSYLSALRNNHPDNALKHQLAFEESKLTKEEANAIANWLCNTTDKSYYKYK